MGQTRQIVGPVLIWLLVAATVGALRDVPSWSAQLAERMAIDPWISIGQIASPLVVAILVLVYVWMLIKSWRQQDNLPFIRLLFGLGATIVVTIINFVLQNTYGNPRPCQVMELGGSCPAETSFGYPSSFAVIAFALAVGLAFAVPWTSYLTFPLAILEGVASVLAGYHYPHDVLVGAVLGGLGAIGLLYMFIKVQTRLAETLTASRAR